jgi:hypothetical protein
MYVRYMSTGLGVLAVSCSTVAQMMALPAALGSACIPGGTARPTRAWTVGEARNLLWVLAGMLATFDRFMDNEMPPRLAVGREALAGKAMSRELPLTRKVFRP